MITEYLSKKIKVMSFISIIAVVFIHAYNYTDTELASWTIITEGKNWGAMIEYTISNGLTRFAVPIFFMISGFLFYRNYEMSVAGYLSKLKKRAISVFIPYIIWAVLSGLLIIILSQVVGLTSSVYVNSYEPKTPILNLILYPKGFQLWYLKALIIFTIIAPLGYVLIKYAGIVTIAVLGILWAGGTNAIVVDIEAYLFFYIGAYIALHNKVELVSKKASKGFVIGNLALWLIISILRTVIASVGPEAVQDMDFGRLFMFYKFGEVFGIAGIWTLYDYAYDYFHKEGKEHKLLEVAASNVFLVFLLHEPLQHILFDTLLGKTGNETTSVAAHLAVYFLLAAALIVLIELLGVFMRKYLRVVHKVLTGGR